MTATTKLTYGSLLNTVTSAADAVGSVFSTTTHAIGMLDQFVTKAANTQRKTYAVDALNEDADLRRHFAFKESEANIRVEEFCAKSPSHAKHYEEAFNRYAELTAPTQDAPSSI